MTTLAVPRHAKGPREAPRCPARRVGLLLCAVVASVLAVGASAYPAESATSTTITTIPHDSFFDSSSATTSWGTLAQLYVRSCLSGSNCNRRTVIKFDVSSVPTDAAVKSANLQMLMSTAPAVSRTYQAYRLTSDWTEGNGGNFVSWTYRLTGSVAWTTAGGDYTGTAVSVTTGTAAGVWLGWDIKDMVQGWVTTPATNFGTLIKDAAEGNPSIYTGVFPSSEDGTAGNRPKLTVGYLRKVTGLAATPGTSQVSLTWTNPGTSPAYNGTLIIRKMGGAPTWTPTDGTVYSAGYSPDGGATVVVLNDTSLATAFTDTGLPTAATYYYHAFARDSSNQYSFVSSTASATVAVNVTMEASGNVTSQTAADPSCALPSGIKEGDIGLWHTLSKDNVNHDYSGATGWTKMQQINQTTALTHSWAWIRFDGTESGSRTVSISGSALKQCKISLWRGLRASGAPFEAWLKQQGTSNVINPIAVSITNSTDVIVALIAVADDNHATNAIGPMTGGSGVGTVVEEYEHPTALGNDSNIALHRAPATTTGSVDLGSDGISASEAWITYTIALVPLTCGTVDDVTYVAASSTAGTNQVTVYWSSPSPALILRKTTPFGTSDAPDGGRNYAAGDTINGGASTVVYSGAAAASSFTDSGLTLGTTYYYKIFTNATRCYSMGAGVDLMHEAAASTAPVWSYAMAGGSMLKPGISGYGALYTGSNSGRIIGLDTSSGAHLWAPVATSGIVQGWLSWLPGGWQYRKQITIDRTKVSGNLTDFPVLISFTDPDLQSSAQAGGGDIVFTASDGATRLSHEIEQYDGTTGKLTGWVRVPSLSSTTDTVLYMYYGDPTAPDQQDSANVWDTGFKGVWHLSQDPAGAAPQMQDATSNPSPNDGTSSGAMSASQQVAGKVGGSLNFDGSDDFVVLGNPTPVSLRINGAITVEAWINSAVAQTSQAQFAKIVQFWGGTSAAGYGLFFNDTRTMIGLSTSNGTTQDNIFVPITVTPGAWHHVVGTWSPNPGSKVIYIDGIQQTPQASSNVTIKSNTQWYVGLGNNDIGGCFSCFNGKIDEVRISSVARSAAWIATSYNNQSAPGTIPTTAGKFYTVGAAEQTITGGTIIGGDQSGRVYSVDAFIGTPNWTADLSAQADAIQAGVAVQMRTYSDATFRTQYTTDVIFAASRNTTATNCGTSATNNKLFALRGDTGASLWTFNETCTHSIDYIVGIPYIDYSRNRIYLATRGTGSTLWILSTLDGSVVEQIALGNLDTSPALSADGATIYVGSPSGLFHAVDTTTFSVNSYNLGSAVKSVIWEDWSNAGRLYFTTVDGNLWCLQNNGDGTFTEVWKVAVPGASTPMLLDKLYVGSSDGRLHEFDTDGTNEKVFPASGTLDGTTVGDVSTEDGTQVFVGTSGGKLFRIQVPLP